MTLQQYATALGPELLAAIEAKGFTELSSVQRAVLDDSLRGRDLRITSQTGSGKTLAIGLTLRDLAEQPAPADSGVARPRAVIVAPTRELAHQVQAELTWLYASTGSRLASTTGGASYRDEHRALARGPSIVVGTPGRLLDHLKRGSIDASQVGAVVLDEADRMLDLGFRADLEAIFEALPDTRRTHLVSATFPRAVRALADSVQHEPALVEGTRLGAANADIDHVLHVVASNQRLDAIINLLLANPEEQTLVFVRTRADAGQLANELVMAGFSASGLSGEMDQAARTRTLAAFKRGGLRALIATDVAARGIDIQAVARVVHAELPTNADAYTHRAGRTGRAGRKGTSSLLVAPAVVVRATRLLRGLGVAHRFEPIPTAEAIRSAQDERLYATLTAAELDAESHAADGGEDGDDTLEARSDSPITAAPSSTRWRALAERLVKSGTVERSLERLLARAQSGPEPRVVVQPADHNLRAPMREREREREPKRWQERSSPRSVGPRGDGGSRDDASPRNDTGRYKGRPPAGEPRRAGDTRARMPREGAQEFVPFRVSWGSSRGADARRLLAVVCRRGDIRGSDVGAIHVERNHAVVDVARDVATGFASAAARPDPDEPYIRISPERPARAPAGKPAAAEPEAKKPPRKAGTAGAGFKPFKRRAKRD